MAIVGAEDIFKKISSQIDSQFPGFIREEGPQFVAFLKAYFEYMEQQGKAINTARTIRDNQDIDRTIDSFVEYFRKEFMVNVPKDVIADKRLLAKHIRDFYRTRGSQESYRFLFRALYGEELEFYYPGDDILRASDGRWVEETRLRVGAPSTVSPRTFEGKRIRGITSGATALVEDIVATEALGILVYDMTVRNVSGVFVDGERVVNIDNTNQYATVSSQLGSIIDFDVINGGAYHNLDDRLEITGAGSTELATAIVTEVTNKSAVTLKIVKAGSGYTKENARLVITGGNGTGFAAEISSYSQQAIGGTSINTDLIGPMRNVVLNTGRFFVRAGANTSTVATKLTGTVSTSTVANTITGSGTNFTTQLAVGDLVRIAGVANTARVHSITNATSFISTITPLQNVSGANAYIGLAAANVSTRLVSALNFSTTEFYSVNAITITNPGYGYNTSLPTITVVDDFIKSLNLSDGYGNIQGNNAVILANNAPGTIKKIRILTAGENFNKYELATLTNTTRAAANYTESLSSAFANGAASTRYLRRQTVFPAYGKAKTSGFVRLPGRYIDTKGFLSWNNKLQDNFYYQEFSYVLVLSKTLNKYKDIIKSLVHPAGTKMFGQFVMSATANVNITLIDEAPSIARGVARETITATATHTATAEYNSGINLTESITADVVEAGQFVANNAITESVTSIVVDDATYLANGSISESATLTVVDDGSYIANTAASESVSSAVSLDAGLEFAGDIVEDINEIILDYANDQNSGYANTEIYILAGLQDISYGTFVANTSAAEAASANTIQQGQRFTPMLNVYAKVLYANAETQSLDSVQILTYDPAVINTFDGSAKLVFGTAGPYQFANGAITANTGSINVGGIGSNLYIIPVGGSNTNIFNVNAIFSNTIFSLRQNYIPTQPNVSIYYSTGP